MHLNVQDILRLLEPGHAALIWSIFLYIIFFFALITLFSMPDKNMVPTLLIGAVLLFAIVAKLSITAFLDGVSQPIIHKGDFGMYVINVAMFVFPILAVGMTRARKNRSVAPAIITALTGAVYFFMFWLIVQRPLG